MYIKFVLEGWWRDGVVRAAEEGFLFIFSASGRSEHVFEEAKGKQLERS